MTTYTSVFGSETIPPSEYGFSAMTLNADTTFYWPELASGSDLMASIMEVTPDAAWAMTLPAANEVSTGRDVLIRNLGNFTITLKDNGGSTIGTVAAGAVKYLYLTANSTTAGTWSIFTFGTGTSAADAAALAGYGMTATGSELSQNSATTISAIAKTLAVTDRAGTFSFTNSGTVACTFPSSATVGNGWFVNVSNQGTGTVTLTMQGGETIDNESTKALAPGESCTIVSAGTANWSSIGYGRSTAFQFTKLVLDVSGGAATFALNTTQAANKLMNFIGTITGNVIVTIPAVVGIYYIQNNFSGAFTVEFKTAAGTGISMSNTDNVILYCDGVNVVNAQTSSLPTANLSGGVAGALVYQTGGSTTGFSAAGTTGQVAISGGTGAPTWSNLSIITNAATGKATPVDADSLPLYDSAATTTATKVTWANVKATLKTYFDTLYGLLGTANTWTAGQTVRAAAGVRVEQASTQDAIAIVGRAGGTSNYEVTLTPTTLAADRTLTVPDETGTIATQAYVTSAVGALTTVPTGATFDYVGTTAPSGYVMLSGRTIGNGSSGGTERANADTSDLFTLLWNSMSDTEAAVSGGRGASAAADFAANKTIALPDARGRTIAGKDDMGGSTASRITNAGAGIVGTTLGATGGAETHTLTEAQMPAHTHTAGNPADVTSGYYSGGNPSTPPGAVATSSTGGSQAHNNTQPTLILNKIIKL